jgi:hypothetical protein
MPTKREREYYSIGFKDGYAEARREFASPAEYDVSLYEERRGIPLEKPRYKARTKRKLSAWNKYIKANAKKPRFRLRSGSPNLKKLAVAFRKTPAGRKKKRR